LEWIKRFPGEKAVWLNWISGESRVTQRLSKKAGVSFSMAALKVLEELLPGKWRIES
jgi:hypothetical protein